MKKQLIYDFYSEHLLYCTWGLAGERSGLVEIVSHCRASPSLEITAEHLGDHILIGDIYMKKVRIKCYFLHACGLWFVLCLP